MAPETKLLLPRVPSFFVYSFSSSSFVFFFLLRSYISWRELEWMSRAMLSSLSKYNTKKRFDSLIVFGWDDKELKRETLLIKMDRSERALATLNISIVRSPPLTTWLARLMKRINKHRERKSNNTSYRTFLLKIKKNHFTFPALVSRPNIFQPLPLPLGYIR